MEKETRKDDEKTLVKGRLEGLLSRRMGVGCPGRVPSLGGGEVEGARVPRLTRGLYLWAWQRNSEGLIL